MRYTLTNHSNRLFGNQELDQEAKKNSPYHSETNIENAIDTKLCPNVINTLKQKTVGAQTFAYAPYSRFKVGCCLLVQKPRPKHNKDYINSTNANYKDQEYDFITGCNVENAAFPACVCAERTAICKAISMGYTKFEAICVVGGTVLQDVETTQSHNSDQHPTTTTQESFVTPCGVCRQFIREFVPKDFPVYLLSNKNCTGKDRDHKVMTIDELLPHSFGPGDLH